MLHRLSGPMPRYRSSYLREASTIASFVTSRNAGKCATLPPASARLIARTTSHKFPGTKYTNFRFTRVKNRDVLKLRFVGLIFQAHRSAGPIKFRMTVEFFERHWRKERFLSRTDRTSAYPGVLWKNNASS